MKVRSKCRSCGADIIWMKTKSGKHIPVDYNDRFRNAPLFDPELGHITHFATCPNADKHRKPKGDNLG